MTPMAALDTKFFLNLDLESSEVEEGAPIQQIFQNETYVLSKDNSNYIENLKKQMAALDRLNKHKQ